jgi:hypothetical protein
MGSKFMTFWGRLRKDNSLVTSEGTLRDVLHEDEIPYNVYGFFLLEKRHNKYIVQVFLRKDS